VTALTESRPLRLIELIDQRAALAAEEFSPGWSERSERNPGITAPKFKSPLQRATDESTSVAHFAGFIFEVLLNLGLTPQALRWSSASRTHVLFIFASSAFLGDLAVFSFNEK